MNDQIFPRADASCWLQRACSNRMLHSLPKKTVLKFPFFTFQYLLEGDTRTCTYHKLTSRNGWTESDASWKSETGITCAALGLLVSPCIITIRPSVRRPVDITGKFVTVKGLKRKGCYIYIKYPAYPQRVHAKLTNSRNSRPHYQAIKLLCIPRIRWMRYYTPARPSLNNYFCITMMPISRLLLQSPPSWKRMGSAELVWKGIVLKRVTFVRQAVPAVARARAK